MVMTGTRAGSSVLVVVALLAATTGCTGSDGPARVPPGPDPTPTLASPPSESPAWSRGDVRVDRVSGDPPMADSVLPTSFPPDDAVLPDLLADPPGRARVAYHPREAFDDGVGWAGERVFFLGTDDEWRCLEMIDLGLPESTHPGWDTYGPGHLSPDGTRWAAKTDAGIVLLDLRSGSADVVPLPGRFTNYLSWRPDGRRVDVRRYGGPSRYHTWTVDPRSLTAVRTPYRLPVDGYAADGAVHTFDRAAEGSIQVVHRGRTAEARMVPVPHRIARRVGPVGTAYTVFGVRQGVLVVDNDSWAPVALLRRGLDWPRAWLDEDTLIFPHTRLGLVTWDVMTGEVRTVTRVRPGDRRDSYWTASLAVDLMR